MLALLLLDPEDEADLRKNDGGRSELWLSHNFS